jgi:shikimate dehydrogenase
MMDTSISGLPLPLSGATRLYAIIGEPIAQAGSPGLFNAAFRRKGIGAVLVPFHVSPDGVSAVLAAFRAGRNFDGLIVTVPHKIAIASLLDEVGSMGQRIGAVNAIRKLPDGRLMGDNFDGLGFVRGLSKKGQTLCGKRVLLIGAGGAGKAVAHAVVDEEPAALGLFDIDCDRLDTLLANLRHLDRSVDLHAAQADAYGYDVVVNCTSVGMRKGDPLPLAVDRLNPATLVVDIVLDPANTPLLQEAARRGCATHQGINMLEGQVEEICRFFGLPEDQYAHSAS